MDIKLKSKIRGLWLFFSICAVTIIACAGFCYFLDNTLNGTMLDWFEKNFTKTEPRDFGMNGMVVYISVINYEKLKLLFFWALTGGMLFCVVAVCVVSVIYSKGKVKKTTKQITETIQEYMCTEKSAAEIFPQQYMGIMAQMAEIKTKMQRREQILKEESARKNDLIVYLAHDLKTPLTSVIGYLSILEELPDMPEQQKGKYVKIALDKAGRLEKLINEFFDIARYNLQEIQLEKETMDLSYMLVQMADEFYPLLQAHGNTAELCVGEGEMICGDAEKLARVFNNILKNAVAYSYPDTAIKIWTRQNTAAIKIFFQNRGKTIPPHKLAAIFEKFYRLDEARGSNTGGAGLGLAIAKEIVTLHKGTITAQSEDETTTFCVELPFS